MSTDPPPDPAPHPASHVVFVGLMGAGKTTVGQLLARTLGVGFVDNDQQLLAATGLSARDLQQQHGRAALHAAELHAVRDALADNAPSVVNVAASVVDTEAGRSLLAAANVVWLAVVRHAHPLAKPADDHRPPRADDAAVENAGRIEAFRELADVIIDHDLSPDEIVTSLTPWAQAALRT